jgi:tRNA(fMet)-specific endonuclease VapC
MSIPWVLDTDHMSLLEWGGADSLTLRERLADCDPREVATTIISFEEQMRGWMAYIARSRGLAKQVDGYRRLRGHLDNYRQVPILDFDDAAAEEFQRLRRARVRVGTMDLKIAAIALSRDATLLSRNIRDFGKIPALRVEDWTK